jgi:hypothetical protein
VLFLLLLIRATCYSCTAGWLYGAAELLLTPSMEQQQIDAEPTTHCCSPIPTVFGYSDYRAHQHQP